MSSPVEHTDVGAYALGLLDAHDQVAFEAHLAGCPRCQAELCELRPVRGLFDGLDAGVFNPVREPPFRSAAVSPAVFLPSRAREPTRRRGRIRVVRALAAVAASLALLVTGMAVGGGFEAAHVPRAGPETTAPSGVRHPASGFAPGVGSAVAAALVERTAWGSHVALELRGVRGPLHCFLVAVGKNGDREVIGNWTVPEKGYGVPSNPDPLVFHGGTSFAAESLDRLEVEVVGGQQLVTIPVER